MKQTAQTISFILFFILNFYVVNAQSLIWTENFESNGHETRYIASSDGGFRDGTNDYFSRTDGGDINIEATNYTGFSNNYFWAAEDTDDNGGDGNDEQVIQFTGINISGYSNLSLSGLFGSGNNFGPGNSFFDSGDYIKVNYRIDNGNEINGIWFSYEDHGDNYNEPLSLDADFDGNADQIDGTNRLNSTLQQFAVSIPTGTILYLTIKISTDSGSEEVAIDDLQLTGNLSGTPIPAIALSKTELSGFEYMESTGPSISKSFFVSGSNLTGNIMITPPLNYEISTDDINFQSTPINIIESSGNASSTIHTRLKADLASGSFNSESIIFSSTGASNKTVTCNGAVTTYVELPNAWINEFHYDNISIDTEEFIEVIIENAISYNLSDFTVSLYNGANGEIYISETVDNFTSLESDAGYSFYYFPINGIQNGPDGIGLDWQGFHIQLLSYEGSFKATEGPANNKYANDILIEESSTKTPEGYSLQLKGTGYNYGDFRWTSTKSTAGLKGSNQVFNTPIPAVPFNYKYLPLLLFLLVLSVFFRFIK